MSKFQSTISTVAALASIFGAGAAGWKLAQTQQTEQPVEIKQPAYEERINQLEQKIEQTQQPVVQNLTPPPVSIQPSYATQPQTQITQGVNSQPTPPPLPPVNP